MTTMSDQRNWMAMGIRYEPLSFRPLVPLLTIAAKNNPIVIASWYAPTMVPRIHFGAVSDWYIGTAKIPSQQSTLRQSSTPPKKILKPRTKKSKILDLGTTLTWKMKSHLLSAETNPTPKPAKNRPAIKRSCSVLAVCKMTPRLNTKPHATIRPQRRPSRSPKGAAASAPKKVPAERMETMRESSAEVSSPSASVANSFFQYFIARMPEIVPVSYLHFD